MGCDMAAALGRATVDGQTLFGLNSHRPQRECQTLQLVPGREFSSGEKVLTQFLEIPQARTTYAVLGSRPQDLWGYNHGVNEHRLAVGCATLRTRLRGQQPGLLGTDLVRLTLERCRMARQAVDLLVGLVERHGQGPFPGCPGFVEGDNAFLIADPVEAFVVETTGRYWVYQEIHQLRAASDVCLIRQDWDRISPGLAGHAIEQGWWQADGSKLDFAGAFSASSTGLASALRRWGRATLMLEEQNGHIDRDFLRRMLADHYEGTPEEVDPLYPANGPFALCRHAAMPAGSATVASIVAALPADPDVPLRTWCAFGPPCTSLYFPVFLDGELPAVFSHGGEAPRRESLWWRVQQLGDRMAGSRDLRNQARGLVEDLQGHLDQEADTLADEGAALKRKGDQAEWRRRAGLFMQYAVEQWDKVLEQLNPATPSEPAEAETAGRVRD